MHAMLAALALLYTAAAVAQEAPGPAGGMLAVLIDDLGVSLAEGRRVLRLPGPVACAILPHQPFSQKLAVEAHAARKEILLHLPMEPEEEHEAGPGQIDAGMPPLELRAALHLDLETVPHAVGVNNHMGSRLTRLREPMQRLMQLLRERGGLFFVDSRTTPQSLAAETARAHGVPALTRDVFLDNDRREQAIEQQFDLALRLARQRGTAIVIGHPYPETLAVLERRLPRLAENGVVLATLSRLLSLSTPENRAWHSSLSR